MKIIRCILIFLNGILKMLKELVKRYDKVVFLFCEEDERFFVKEFEIY